MTDPDQTELFSDMSILVLARSLIRDLHDDLPRRVSRFRYIADISASMGEGGTMIFGGHAASNAYLEARSSFVNGNFIATILLCQSLIENLLAAYLHVTTENLPRSRRTFRKGRALCDWCRDQNSFEEAI